MSFMLLAGASLGSQIDALFSGFDFSVFSFFGNLQNDFLTVIAQLFTALGSTSFSVMIGILALGFCFFKKTRKYGFAVIFALLIGLLVTNIIIKPTVARVRPYNTLQHISEYWQWYCNAGMLAEADFCFPSGHTTSSVEMAVALCACFISNKKGRIAWIFPAAAFIVGCSRVYLMVHYATDVIGGMIIGTASGIIAFLLSRLLCRKLDKSAFGSRVDLSRFISRKQENSAVPSEKKFRIPFKAAVIAAIVYAAVSFGISFNDVWTFAHSDVQRCAYDDEYSCMNEARTSGKYHAIDGEFYCKIHFNELTEGD